MKVALVHSVRAPGAQRFAWKWRSEDGARRCEGAFVYFFECCEDARKAGYECKFDAEAGGAANWRAAIRSSAP